MKKLFYVLSMAVAAMSISACNNLIEEESPAFGAGSDNKIVFTASTEAEAEGRTALDLSDGQSVVWNGTEKFGLFYYYTPAGGQEVKFVKNYVYTANANGTESAKFTGEAAWWDGDGDVATAEAATHKVYIYYPYSAANDSKNSSAAVGTLPAEQEYDATASVWDMSAYDFLYTTDNPATYGEALTFDKLKRLFAVLRLGITNKTGEDVEIQKVTITSEGGKILAGDFVVNLSKGRAENALTNRTDAPVKGTHGSSSAYGYWTAPLSSISTIVSNGAVKANEQIDVRFVINAGYAKSDDSSVYFFDTTTPYLEGDTFTVNIITNKGTHPAVSFTAGALLRGQRAGKSIVLDAVPDGAPSVLSMESSDSFKNNYYLNSNIVLKGTNLLNITNLKIGGVAAEIVSLGNSEVVAKVPDCTGSATSVAAYDVTYGDSDTSLGQVNVYPFYHYENILLGIGSNSNKNYADIASENAYFVPDMGKVYSAEGFVTANIDPYACGKKTNDYVTSKNTYPATMTDAIYAAALPYMAFITNSDGKLTMSNPIDSSSVLKTHRYKVNASSYNTYVGEGFGTVCLKYRVMHKSEEKSNYAEPVKNGTLTSMDYTLDAATANAPAYAPVDKLGNSAWNEGSVLLVAYKHYDQSTTLKNGFIYIKDIDVTDGELSSDGKYQFITESAAGVRDGKIIFDMYWSK